MRTVFLDRDGVINKKMPEGQYVRSWDEFQLLPAVPEAIARLNRKDLRVVIVSNQRGIALDLYTAADVLAIHSSLQKMLADHNAHIDALYFCPHEKGECTCRKPLPGMFEQASREFPDISAGTSVMIGDSLSDIEFGRRLGMSTIFISGDIQCQKTGAAQAKSMADAYFNSLRSAVDVLLTP